MKPNFASAVTFGLLSISTLIPIGLVIGQSNSNSNPKNYGEWPLAGRNIYGTRNQPNEHLINTSNASTLAPAWVFTTGAGVSATPTVAGAAIYFPDWAGNLYAVSKAPASKSGRIK
jgi:hypothetical protein